jgi:uncharacterized LabA/DUF88 family protein
MLANYFFIDGSALTAQIRVLQRQDRSFEKRRLVASKLIESFCKNLAILGARDFKRATFYFPKGDEVAIEDYLVGPEFNKPGAVRDIQFKFCGQKLKGSAPFTEFVESTVPLKWRDRFSKSEKGVDIEICCDALKLASASRMERLFLLTNDDDFLPLCRTLKEFGTNISIIHLTDFVAPNTSLVSEVDSYDVVPGSDLQDMFVPPFLVAEQEPAAPATTEPIAPSEPKATKPAAETADDPTDK